MAQLIKLQNYITRYEWDIYRYPSQFIRLKQDNWKKLHYLWENQEEMQIPELDEEDTSKKSKWKFFTKKNSPDIEEKPKAEVFLPDSEEELKRYFLNHLLPFQFKWATSTITNVSFVEKKYYTDKTLHYFLQRFPDTFLLMYYPIFEIRNAPIETEIILITPIGIDIIYLLEESPDTIISATEERSWTFERDNKVTKKLSPIFALRRTEKIVRGILDKYEIDFPIEKVVLSRTNIINFLSEPYKTRIIGKNDYENWFQAKRSLSSPLKSNQLKGAEALLKYCQSTYVKRPEWLEEDDDSFIVEEEDS